MNRKLKTGLGLISAFLFACFVIGILTMPGESGSGWRALSLIFFYIPGVIISGLSTYLLMRTKRPPLSQSEIDKMYPKLKYFKN